MTQELLTLSEIAALKALADKATRGPWTADEEEIGPGDECVAVVVTANEELTDEDHANAELIAASREAIPRLCATVTVLAEALRTLSVEWDNNSAYLEVCELLATLDGKAAK